MFAQRLAGRKQAVTGQPSYAPTTFLKNVIKRKHSVLYRHFRNMAMADRRESFVVKIPNIVSELINWLADEVFYVIFTHRRALRA